MQKDLRRIAFLLMPDFPLLGFSAAVDPLRMTNREAGSVLYEWQIVSLDGGPVCASSRVEVTPDCGVYHMSDIDLLLIVAGTGTESYHNPHLYTLLRGLARRGCWLGAITLAPYLLARAGLLNGYRCTVHWENLEAFREEFPKLEVTPEVFEIDGPRLTCSGGSAALDMMLSLVAREHGWELAIRVADLFIHLRVRGDDEPQRMPLRTRMGLSHPKLLRVIELMEQGVEYRYSHEELADAVGLSSRQLERLFRKYLDTTPRQYYLRQRLGRARALLRQTSMPVVEVAVACGFATASHFTKTYRDLYGCTPREERRAVSASRA